MAHPMSSTSSRGPSQHPKSSPSSAEYASTAASSQCLSPGSKATITISTTVPYQNTQDTIAVNRASGKKFSGAVQKRTARPARDGFISTPHPTVTRSTERAHQSRPESPPRYNMRTKSKPSHLPVTRLCLRPHPAAPSPRKPKGVTFGKDPHDSSPDSTMSSPSASRCTRGSKQREVGRGRAAVGWNQHTVQESESSKASTAPGPPASQTTLPFLKRHFNRLNLSLDDVLGHGPNGPAGNTEPLNVQMASTSLDPDPATGRNMNYSFIADPRLQGTDASRHPPPKYRIPAKLQGVVTAMGKSGFAAYTGLICAFLDEKIDETALDRRERALFQTLDERIRRQIRGLMVKMVTEGNKAKDAAGK